MMMFLACTVHASGSRYLLRLLFVGGSQVSELRQWLGYIILIFRENGRIS